MIAVDASAILALVLKEADAGVFEQALALAGQSVMSPVNYWEAQVRAGAVFGEVGRQATRDVMANLGVEVGALSATDAEAAADAFARFGKGSGSGARLNLGDCFAYALAKSMREPLLCKGDDFSHTDVAIA